MRHLLGCMRPVIGTQITGHLYRRRAGSVVCFVFVADVSYVVSDSAGWLQYCPKVNSRYELNI